MTGMEARTFGLALYASLMDSYHGALDGRQPFVPQVAAAIKFADEIAEFIRNGVEEEGEE